MSKYKITSPAIDLIKEFEGYRRDAYMCPSGKWTIGYGSTIYEDGSAVRSGDRINNCKAEYLLITHIENEVLPVLDKIEGLNQNHVNALCSFIFNIGNGAFKNSTMYKLLINKDFLNAAAEFNKWNKSDGKPLLGLTNRRIAERKLFELK